MTSARLEHAMAHGLSLPAEGVIGLFGASAESDLSMLDPARCHAVQGNFPDHESLKARGLAVSTEPEARYAASIVTLPRARSLAEARIAEAVARTPDGPVIVDGAKADGVEAMLKAVRTRVSLDGQTAKAHGKIFWFRAGDAFGDWRSAGPSRTADGWLTAPGVFSADGVDPASAALAAALPRDLGRRVADLGGGWGYLSAQVLEGRAGVTELHLVEADHAALDCARANVPDPRVAFHWADATAWRAPEALDTVVMNPPFHQGRRADPDLGRAFIDGAHRNLASKGTLWLVANRHLPYERLLETLFTRVEEAGGDARFKIVQATGPVRTRR